MGSTAEPRIVLVHDWLTGMRGGEKCLESACARWPEAPIFTLLHRPGSVSPVIEDHPLSTSFLNRLPRVEQYYRYLLPLMPLAAQWRLPECDLVLSFSHCVAKSVLPPPGVPHVCYCFTPMRYAWQMQEAYFQYVQHGSWGKMKSQAANLLLARLRDWDRRTAARVTHFLAISRTVQQRIAESYGRSSDVIYPPVDTEFYTPSSERRESYYLVVSALAPYKRFDLAIQACNRLNLPLLVIGSGQAAKQLQTLAGPTVHFLGWQPDAVIRDHLRRCRAVLYPGEEDFGIVPVEAQACGAPVIAYGRGGATETVHPLGASAEPTGVFFHQQTPEAVVEAIQIFEAQRHEFDPRAARKNALSFRKARYEAELFGYVQRVLAGETVRRAA